MSRGLTGRGAMIAAVALTMVSAAPAMAGGQAAVLASPTANAVDHFYATRQNAPVWLKTPGDLSGATALIEILKNATFDGIAEGPRLASQVEAALAKAQGGDKLAAAEAERVMSGAWITYVQGLSRPTPGMIYGDAARRVVPRGADLILRQAAASPSLAAHLQSVASVNSIYSRLRDAAIKEAQLPGGGNSAKLMANLERVRSIPGKGRVVVVDAATATLWMYQDGQAVDSMKVVVGKLEYATPMIASTIYYATMNPYWHVPDHLVRKTIAPNVVKQGAAYLKARGYQVIERWADDSPIVPADQVDWKAVAAGTTEVKIRQLPGGTNSMGKMKFNFANSEGIYLHDTPMREYFGKSVRTLSNGCIRLEDAARLGRWLMAGELKAPNASPEQHLPLPQGVPVYVTYLTAQPKADGMAYYDDVYGWDRAGARVASIR